MKLNLQGKFWAGLGAVCGVCCGFAAGALINPIIGVAVGITVFGVVFLTGALCCAAGRAERLSE